MGKMFITKYPDIINNDNLLKLGQLKFQFTNAGNGSLQIDGTTFSDGTTTKSISDGTTAIIENKYELTSLRCKSVPGNKGFATTTLTLRDLKFSTKLTHIYYPGAAYLGDESERSLSNLKDLVNLYELNLQDLSHTKDVIGDISFISNLKKLVNLNLTGNIHVSGDISSLANITGLREIYIDGTNVSGDISSLANLIDLIRLSLSNTNVSGDISSLANLINLIDLNLTGSKVHGDISSIVTNLTKLKALAIPTTVTITDEQKKNLTDRGCTVTIA